VGDGFPLRGISGPDFVKRLGAVDFVNSIVLFGASLLLSVLPFIILLSSIANHRIDTDLSRHIGLNHEGAAIVSQPHRGWRDALRFLTLAAMLFGVLVAESIVSDPSARQAARSPLAWSPTRVRRPSSGGPCIFCWPAGCRCAALSTRPC